MDKVKDNAGFLYGDLSRTIIWCAMKVHRKLGPGLSESIYKKALCYELINAKVPFQTEAEVEVLYDGKPCGKYRLDLLVDEKIVLELKAVDALCKDHEAQTISYLKASGMKVGLLMNFGQSSLKLKRLIN